MMLRVFLNVMWQTLVYRYEIERLGISKFVNLFFESRIVVCLNLGVNFIKGFINMVFHKLGIRMAFN